MIITMREWIKKVISSAILFTLLILLTNYIRNHSKDFAKLRIVSPWFFLILLVLAFLIILLNGLVRKYILKVYGLKTKMKVWFGLSAITTFYNTITPFRGGAIVEATYLKKKHDFGITHYLSGFAAQYIIAFFLAGIIGIITMIYLRVTRGLFSLPIFLVFLTIVIIIIIMTFIPIIKETKKEAINKLIRVINGWHEVRKNKKLVRYIILFSVIELVVEGIRLILQFSIIGVKISFIEGMFLSTLYYLGFLIAITPGGLGIQEAIIVLSAGMLGINPAQSIAASVIGRAMLALLLFVIGPIYSYKLLKIKDEEIKEELFSEETNASKKRITKQKSTKKKKL